MSGRIAYFCCGSSYALLSPWGSFALNALGVLIVTFSELGSTGILTVFEL
jgi:hypothetical protein